MYKRKENRFSTQLYVYHSIYLNGLKLINDNNGRIASFTDFINEHKKEDDVRRDTDLQANEFIDLSIQFKEVLEAFK